MSLFSISISWYHGDKEISQLTQRYIFLDWHHMQQCSMYESLANLYQNNIVFIVESSTEHDHWFALTYCWIFIVSTSSSLNCKVDCYVHIKAKGIIYLLVILSILMIPLTRAILIYTAKTSPDDCLIGAGMVALTINDWCLYVWRWIKLSIS